MPDLTLHLRGSFRASTADERAVSGLSRRGQAMLAYLACQVGYRAERGTLMALLWPDRSDAQARASLRQELSMLRKALPDGLLAADKHAVWLAGERIACERGDGVFLQGFDLASEEFEDWLRAERATAASGAPRTAGAMPLRRERPSLAVMPFDEFGTEAADMLADGIVDEVTGALSRVQAFHVIARQSAFALKGQTLTVPQVADILGADYLIEGSVRRSGERIRVAIQLVQGRDGQTLWSHRFDDRVDDLFDLQDRIAAQIAGQLSPNLRAAEIARAKRARPDDRTAYDLMLTALPHFWIHDSEHNERAITLLDAALAQTPDYGPALAQRAWCKAHRCCYLWTLDPDAARDAARIDFEAAFPLVSDHAPALTALSATAALALADYKQADDLARRALDIDPNNAWAWLRLGWVSAYAGRPGEALQHLDQAQKLSPLDPFLFNIDFGRAASLRMMKDYDGAIAHIERGLRAAPKAVWAYRMLFGTLWLKGDRDGAVAAGRTWLSHHPGMSKRILISGVPESPHDSSYIDVLTRFEEIIPDAGNDTAA